MASLEAEFCGHVFRSCIINAAGSRDGTIENLTELGRSDAGAIVLKTATIESRIGNVEPRWHLFHDGGVNAMGVPNPGVQVYAAEVERLRREFGKPIFASISAQDMADCEEMIRIYDSAGVDFIELDMSCPNVTGVGVLGYEHRETRLLLNQCREMTQTPLGPKLPPYLHVTRMEQIAQAIVESRMDFIAASNTLGQALVIDSHRERKVLAANDGLGGLSGSLLRPIALSNVYTFGRLLRDANIPIVGIGGVTSGEDAFSMLLAGATLVGVATAFIREGPQVFARLGTELTGTLDRQRYDSPAAARGKLVDCPPETALPPAVQARQL
jgi:dihydroorotate dehydrogenase (fumarate)